MSCHASLKTSSEGAAGASSSSSSAGAASSSSSAGGAASSGAQAASTSPSTRRSARKGYSGRLLISFTSLTWWAALRTAGASARDNCAGGGHARMRMRRRSQVLACCRCLPCLTERRYDCSYTPMSYRLSRVLPHVCRLRGVGHLANSPSATSPSSRVRCQHRAQRSCSQAPRP